jgi:type III pantothenate kinase
MSSALVTVDLGNSRLKFGLFEGTIAPTGLPTPSRLLEIGNDEWDGARVLSWLPPKLDQLRWYIGSVNRESQAVLLRWIMEQQLAGVIPGGTSPSNTVQTLDQNDLGLTIRVDHPERVGIDRLLGSIGANALRPPKSPAITIHLGSALTVNLIAADGAFCGGAILPGIGMSARALHDFTDLLPLVPMRELNDPPEAIGTSTVSAMRSGLYWGAVGAMRELLAQISKGLKPEPEVYLTGGAAPHVAKVLAPRAQHVPHLILGAIARVAQTRGQTAASV